MPYDPSNPSSLPEVVQKLPAKRQRMWANVFNSAYSRCMKGKSGDDAQKKCESSAFAQAHAVSGVGKASNSATFSTSERVEVAEFELPAEPGPLYEDGETVWRAGRLFRVGEYPDKTFAMTVDELRDAVEDFSGPLPLDLEHVPTPLDGKIGELVSIECSDDGAELHGIVALPKWLDSILDERKVSATWDRATKRLAGLALVRNPRVSDAALMAAFNAACSGCEAAAMADTCKKEGDDGCFPASDYAYVPDSSSPSTWKLRLTAKPGGAPDSGIVGAACAALGPGFRGQKVSIPAADRAAVKKKIRTAWKKANPDKSDDDMPDVIKMSEDDALAETLEALFAAARHDTPEGQAILQGIHDTSARGGAVCKSSNTAKMASSHESTAIQRIHDMATDHGAKCSSKTGNGPSFPYFSTRGDRKMSRLEEFVAWLKGDEGEGGGSGATVPPPAQAAPPLPAQAVMATPKGESDEARRLREELAEERERRRKLEFERIHERAANFTDRALKVDKRILPTSQEFLTSLYEQLAIADGKLGAVTFADGHTETYVGMLEKFVQSMPKSPLTDELLSAGLHSTLVALANQTDTPGTKDGPLSREQMDKLLAMTPGGRATLAARKSNGKGA